MPRNPAPTNAKTILITAGEPSGDRLGGALMAELKARHPNLRFLGTGGEHMQKQGLNPLFPMSDLAVMGLAEVLPSIPRILNRLKQLVNLAEATRPDLIITIDLQDFSSRLAKALRAAYPLSRYPDTPIPHIHYVAPKMWAWRQGRAAMLRTRYTHMLAILPFEKDFYKHYDISVSYVGHPATTALAPYISPKHQAPDTKTLALLPGSRTSELTRHWPMFLQTYRILRTQTPGLTAVLALPDEKALRTCRHLAPILPEDAITPIFGEARFPHLANATAALAKSGTNNLELALLNTPAVVTYRMNPLTYFIAKHMVKVPFISLPNLILHYSGQPPVYPELIQHAATPHTLTATLLPLLAPGAENKTQHAKLKTFHTLMTTPKPPAILAADVIDKYL